jgi:hypothetical protein
MQIVMFIARPLGPDSQPIEESRQKVPGATQVARSIFG